MAHIVWFRRDFRLHDHTALFHAVREAPDSNVIPVFIFDDAILKHPDMGGAIVEFMLGCLQTLKENLGKQGVELLILHGTPVEQLEALVKQTGATGLYFNRDYHPAAVERDDEVTRRLTKIGVTVKSYKDQVIFEQREIIAASTGEPYTVYTPYAKTWRSRLAEEFDPGKGPATWDAPKLSPHELKVKAVGGLARTGLPTTEELGFRDVPPRIEIPSGEDAARKLLRAWCAGPVRTYKDTRDLPSDATGTSRLSPHLRHGTLSPRQCLRAAMFVAGKNPAFKTGADGWIGELIWREFYQQILFNFPHVVEQPFKRHLAGLPWREDRAQFRRWCDGTTGYPIVDAAMRQLNQTGWMHNRLRMIVAMFLTKDLRIDYRWGERYFMQKLLDGETAQNNGGWQWSSSTGTDAQPYFRIFNPRSQSEKFDPEGAFIRRYVPELARVPAEFVHAPHEMTPTQQEAAGCRVGRDYPFPLVDHDVARQQTLGMFKGFAPAGR